jgi:hypothetical protein
MSDDDYTADELKDKIRDAVAQLEHIKKSISKDWDLDDIRHAIDHAISDLDFDLGVTLVDGKTRS